MTLGTGDTGLLNNTLITNNKQVVVLGASGYTPWASKTPDEKSWPDVNEGHYEHLGRVGLGRHAQPSCFLPPVDVRLHLDPQKVFGKPATSRS